MKTTQDQNLLQHALLQAAKVGNIKLMREFIEAGADPFALDADDMCAFQYAKQADPVKCFVLLTDLIKTGYIDLHRLPESINKQYAQEYSDKNINTNGSKEDSDV